jgi:hypothetical protein
MKSIFMAFSVMLLVSFTGVAQNKKATYIGLRVGYSSFTMTGEDVELSRRQGSNVISRKNFEIGIASKIDLNRLLYLKIEALYLQKGGLLENRAKLEVDYLTFPVLIGLGTPAQQNPRLGVEVGIAGNFNLREGLEPLLSRLHPDNVVQRSSFITSFVAGADLTHHFTKGALFINARLHKDLSTFFERTYYYDFSQNNAKSTLYDLQNIGYTVSLGYLIKI